MRILFFLAAALQVAAVVYCAFLLSTHRKSPAAWMWLLGALLSMLVWRAVMTTGGTPGPVFNISIAIWGSVCAVLAMLRSGTAGPGRSRARPAVDQ
jgi:hypothetical protein